MDDISNDSASNGTVSEKSQVADSVDTAPATENKRISDTQAALKDLQRDLHQLAKERAELRGEVNAIKTMKAEKPEEKDWVASRAWAEKLKSGMETDPAEAVSQSLEMAVQNLRRDMVMLAEARDGALKDEIRRLVSEATNPELNEYREVMSELAKDIPGYDGLSKEQQIAFAKKFASSKPAASTVSRATPPSGFGKSRSVVVDSDADMKRRESDLRAKTDAIFGSLNKKTKGVVEVN